MAYLVWFQNLIPIPPEHTAAPEKLLRVASVRVLEKLYRQYVAKIRLGQMPFKDNC